MDALIATVTEPAQWLMVGVDCGSMGCDVVMFAWVCVCVCTAIWNSILDHYVCVWVPARARVCVFCAQLYGILCWITINLYN